MRHDGNQPLSLQLAQGFTNRNTADGKFLGDGVLAQLVAFLDLTSQDLLAKLLGNSRRKRSAGNASRRCAMPCDIREKPSGSSVLHSDSAAADVATKNRQAHRRR